MLKTSNSHSIGIRKLLKVFFAFLLLTYIAKYSICTALSIKPTPEKGALRPLSGVKHYPTSNPLQAPQIIIFLLFLRHEVIVLNHVNHSVLFLHNLYHLCTKQFDFAWFLNFIWMRDECRHGSVSCFLGLTLFLLFNQGLEALVFSFHNCMMFPCVNMC